MIKFGTRLKFLRNKKEMTQQELAEMIGITSESISRYENGLRMPDMDTIVRLANYFEISVDELLGNPGFKERIKRRKLVEKIVDRLLLLDDKLLASFLEILNNMTIIEMKLEKTEKKD